MKFRLIFETDEITILTEDGGIACIREAEAMSPDEPRIAVTDYYQMRITDVPLCTDNLFEYLAEGKMYHKDWPDTPYNNVLAIQDALAWLCLGETNWEVSDEIFPQFFAVKQVSKPNIIPTEYLEQIANADAFELLDMVLEAPSLLTNSFTLNVIKQRNKKLATGEAA